MAIVQISQITNRKGLAIDLPAPLAGAELGWSTDTRQLWIGNGTLEDGAPVIGNTEILTEFSNALIANTNVSVTSITASGPISTTDSIEVGNYITQSAAAATLPSGAGNISLGITTNSFTVNYTLSVGAIIQVGQLLVVSGNSINNNVQTGNTAITLTGNTNPAVINYNNAGNTAATLKYSISYFN